MPRIGVIGLGQMGLRHLEAIESIGFDLVAVCDLNQQRVDEALSSPGREEVLGHTDPGHLLEEGDCDAIVIATTANHHESLCLQALDAGVERILCEKPLATSLAGCDRMIQAAKETGSLLAVNHNRRFSDRFLKVREFLSRHDFGRLTSMTVSGGNFGLAMNGLHYIEAFHQLAGEPIEDVFCQFTSTQVPNPRGDQFVDPGGFLHGTTPSGVRLTLEAGADQGHGLQVTYGGHLGQLTVDEGAGWMRWNLRSEATRELPTTRYYGPAEIGEEVLEPASVVDPTGQVLKCLVQGHGFPTAEEATAAIRVLVAGYQSAGGGTLVGTSSTRLNFDHAFPWA